MSALDEVIDIDSRMYLAATKDACAELSQLRARSAALSDLLDVIYRDGGQYERDHGTNAALSAQTIVVGLRADLKAAQTQIAMLDDYAETIRRHEITIAAQAQQLEQARELLTSLNWNDWDESVDAWLAENAPQPQEQEA